MSSCGMEGDLKYKHEASFSPPSWARSGVCDLWKASPMFVTEQLLSEALA